MIAEKFKTHAVVKAYLANGGTLLEVVKHYLSNIEANNSKFNVFLEVFTDEALVEAERIQEKIANGTAGRLAGMVVALKDNICYKQHKVSASSKILENFESLFSATAVERMLAEDVIIIGRTNCDEFAMGSSNENSAFGNVHNPLREGFVPGGSSGGSASAVAANMCTASLGSDTGGSIRQPASFCGLVGMKGTYGRVSRHGLIAYASSFDQIGPFSHNVEDSAILMEVIAGKDDYDSTVSTAAVDKYSEAKATNTPKKIAYIKEAVESEGTDPEIKAAFHATIKKLKAEGHAVEAVSFPYLEYMVPAYYVLTTAEASSNLARFDGIHYGYRAEGVKGINDTYVKSRTEGFGAEVKRRIMLGTFVLSSGYYDAYYSKAQKVRQRLKSETEAIFQHFDVIILPTTPTTSFEIGKKSDDPITMYLEDIYTVQANLTGIPAISLPLGKHSNGLPFGFQVMSPAGSEQNLFEFSKLLENL